MPERVADAIAEIARPTAATSKKNPKSTRTPPCGDLD
jgi:hypothetical protein